MPGKEDVQKLKNLLNEFFGIEISWDALPEHEIIMLATMIADGSLCERMKRKCLEKDDRILLAIKDIVKELQPLTRILKMISILDN